MAGLLPRDAGEVVICGLDVSAKPVAVKSRIGVVTESSNLYPELRCRRNIEYLGELYGLGACEVDATDWINRQIGQQEAQVPGKLLANETFTFGGLDYEVGTAHTPIDACTIQRFNGAPYWVIYWHEATGEWLVRGGDLRKYVDDISQEYIANE